MPTEKNLWDTLKEAIFGNQETGENLWNTLKEVIFGDKETRENLLNIKKSIAKEYISEIKKWNKNIEDNEEIIENYLINDWTIKDKVKDIFRWCFLSIMLSEDMDKLNKVKDKIASITETTTKEKLSVLKSEIMDLKLQETTQWSISQETAESSTQSNKISVDSQEITEQKNKFIKSIYNRASQQIWKPYSRWWTSPSTWFDCSGLRYRAFKEEWIKFSERLSAHKFSDADVNLKKDQVKPWDFMFWDQKPWKKKHDSIYHIEMIVSKPYTKNWKTYVKTLWSSSDAKDDCGNYVGKWVQIREREMKEYRHYWRPTYYYQLAQYQQTGSSDVLIAWANKPSHDLETQVLSA